MSKPTVKQFEYLDALRESGETNMFGARPYLMNEFGLGKQEASAVLSAWMESFQDGVPAADRLKKAAWS